MNKQLLIQGKFTLEIPDGIPLVYTDDKGLLFVLNQIVHNAAAYADEKPAALSIRFTVNGNLLHLHIRDHGCGIPPQDLPRVFDKGFTGCNGRKNRRSTGMGLYLSQKICRRMEADIQVKSQLGMFTEVVLTFRRKIAEE